jgi:hypothetical protein
LLFYRKRKEIDSSTIEQDKEEKIEKVKFSKISFLEYFHSRIPANRYWSICFEILVTFPSSKRFELVER